jgi:hypothetical protein
MSSSPPTLPAALATALPAALPAALPTSSPACLASFCLAHEEAFLVPAEAISAAGVAAGIGQGLVEAGRLSGVQLGRLSRGVALYWQRCAALHERAPQWWFAPRPLNLLVVAAPADVPPYVVPFVGSSAVLYLSDLGPAVEDGAGGERGDRHERHDRDDRSARGDQGQRSDATAPEPPVELIAYLLAHNERLPLVGTLRGSHLANLSWWFMLTPSERAAFAEAARGKQRPDAAAFVALARGFGWITEAWHDPLRLPEAEPAEPCMGLTGTGLIVPKRAQPDIVALCTQADRAQAAAVAAFRRPRAGVSGATLDGLCDWMSANRAQLDVTAPDGRLLWRAGSTDPGALRKTLREATEVAVASLAADFAVVHERSTTFLTALADPECLPTECALLEKGGSAYIDAARRAVVVPLRASAFDPLQVPAPPYHRLLLGARVMHEWGHLAHKADILRVPEDRRATYRAARERLGQVFAEVLAQVTATVPDALRDAVREELASVIAASPSSASAPQQPAQAPAALARKTLSRVGDFLANLMSHRLIPAAEMQAYVRSNVRHHLDEELGLVAELARYAHEVHYLPLADLPRSYLYETTRFRHDFIESGLVEQLAADELFDAAGAVFACYTIDEAALRLPAAGRA